MTKSLEVEVNEKWYRVEILDLWENPARVTIEGDTYEVTLGLSDTNKVDQLPNTGASVKQISGEVKEPSQPTHRGHPGSSQITSGQLTDQASTTLPSDIKTFTAPMPGTILSMSVEVGDEVAPGDTICVLEAMKMQQSLRANWSGIVKAIFIQPGQQVMNGTPILELEYEIEVSSEQTQREHPEPSPATSGQSTPQMSKTHPSAIKTFTAPMAGTILSISVGVGDQVVSGDTICVLEAMKMQQSLRADWSGIVKTIFVQSGQQVMDGTRILELE